MNIINIAQEPWQWACYLICPLLGYLLGSIPAAWLLTKWTTGRDIRNLGSGNIGVMNTALSASRWAGLLVFLAEGIKGILAVFIPKVLGANDIAMVLAILATVIGTRWSFWLGFRGGRGNTAGLAALLMISWQAIVLTMGVWVLARFLARKSFIATRFTFVLLPMVIFATTHSIIFTLLGLGLCVIYLTAQHRKSDDHLILMQKWNGLYNFLISPPRGKSNTS